MGRLIHNDTKRPEVILSTRWRSAEITPVWVTTLRHYGHRHLVVAGGPLHENRVALTPVFKAWLDENDPEHRAVQVPFHELRVEFSSEAAAFAFKMRWC